MELRKIQFFLHIVECGSLSKAAERLYLTQPTLSRFLAKLEEEVGQPLFRRSKSTALELTEAGKVYLETAKQINELWTSMESKLNTLDEKHRNHIRLGVDSDLLYPYVQKYITALQKQYPNVVVTIQSSDSETIQARIAEKNLDIGVASYFNFNKSLTYAIAVKNEIDLVVNKSHPIARYSYQIPGQENTRISLHSLDPHTPFLLMTEDTVLRKRIDHYMRKISFSPSIQSTYLFPNSIEMIMLSDESLAALCPRSHFPQLAHIALDPPVSFPRGVCFRKGEILSPAESFLLDMLKDLAKKAPADTGKTSSLENKGNPIT